jgi:homoserine kinase type II
VDASAGAARWSCDGIRRVLESRVPVLEMLWEAHDPQQILDVRFGFSDGWAAGRWVADTLDERWGTRIDWCERIG